ncbi:acetyl-coenzyme A transporter-like protein [Dinothrombium tinctorium]|uniref:Acetyl-coenzyme A transporter-like protein n=1 Tax=Dinothrombium tinctorium TaxID=1965070 RepID=A0A443R2D3_9ACAR|nr:acetyl-coenzyme A transporter-like protein [Dinothrombium tinctorium]RWS09398.1 acetyl-coenzyme A transporter-like protein [Dinothrombium tinctorium]
MALNGKEVKLRKNVSNSTAESGDEHDSMANVDDSKANLLEADINVARNDTLSIMLLMLLYVLQGIPLGLAGALPLILQNRHVSYAQQATFSFVNWPFSIKLLWAPIIDAIYSNRFGRRKSWLVPIQYAIACFMYILSSNINSLLGEENTLINQSASNTSNANATVNSDPNIYLLTFVFFALNFLCATQDIAVDGWALTMLSRKNVGWASTCNSVGQTAGYFLGNVVFLSLESPDFCNKYLRFTPQKEGIVTLSSFLYFWSIVFLITTTLIMLFKHESNVDPEHESDLGVVETYSMLYRILRLKSVQLFVVILLTCKIGFAITDSATGLKLIEAGVHKENIALLAVPMVPLQIILPLVISKYTSGPRPLDIFLKAYPYRLFLGIIFALLVYWTKLVRNPIDGTFPLYYYVIILLAYALHQVTLYSMFVALMAFHAKTSDPAIGGTYMTLLNTVTNLGGNWPSTLALYLVDYTTFKSCSAGNFYCNKETTSACIKSGGVCNVTLDGYYVLTAICIILGLFWLKWGKNRVKKIQLLPPSAWKCSQITK